MGRKKPGRNGKTGGEQKRLPVLSLLSRLRSYIGHGKLMICGLTINPSQNKSTPNPQKLCNKSTKIESQQQIHRFLTKFTCTAQQIFDKSVYRCPVMQFHQTTRLTRKAMSCCVLIAFSAACTLRPLPSELYTRRLTADTI